METFGISLLFITAATPFNFPIVMWHEENDTDFNYVIIIGGLNVGDFV